MSERIEHGSAVNFSKGQGLGNDYIVLRADNLPFPLKPVQIQRICDRNLGIGSDGILLLVPSWTGADFGLRIFNPDGSEAEKSGNGLRIFAKYLWDNQFATQPLFTIDTKGGRVECLCHVVNGRTFDVTVEMGTCTFEAARIPVAGSGRDVVEEPLLVGGTTLPITAVSMGNPHCVIFVEALSESSVRRLGPQVEKHEAFPERTNVQFARVLARNEIEIMIWERGAGWTQASGSSSCAVACAAVRTGRCDHGLVTIHMPGGTLEVDVRTDWSVRLHGPVAAVCQGTLSPEFVEDLRKLL